MGWAHLRIRAMHGGQGLDGAEVVLQLGDELLLASQRGHSLRQLDLQLCTAHWKTEPGPSPRGAPKPHVLLRGHQKAENPQTEHQRQQLPFSPYFWGQQEGPAQQSLLCSRPRGPGVQPTLAMPQGRQLSLADPVPCPRARSNGSRRLLAWHGCFKCISKMFSVPWGTWQHPGWAQRGDLERDKGSSALEPIPASALRKRGAMEEALGSMSLAKGAGMGTQGADGCHAGLKWGGDVS